jgi:chaperonin cofactor prefoldin
LIDYKLSDKIDKLEDKKYALIKKLKKLKRKIKKLYKKFNRKKGNHHPGWTDGISAFDR